MQEKHIFTIYTENIIEYNSILNINCSIFYNRVLKILRLKINETIVIFNKINKYLCKINEINKKNISLKILKKETIEKPFLKINLFIPIIEKEYIENVLYFCGQQGAYKIYFVKYENSKNKFEYEINKKRFEKIIISGCEQGKQCFFPEIEEKIISFEQMIKISQNKLIYFDENGKNIKEIFNEKKDNNYEYYITCGPEAGYAEEEKNILLKSLLRPISLGAHTLRSSDTLSFSLVLLNSLNID
jgi:RsmE family RNA methyltransferase